MQNEPVIWLVGAEPPTFTPPEGIKKFVDWYKGTHIPLTLKAPGIVSANFYESVTGQMEYPKFLCIYEGESKEALDAARKSREMQASIEDGRTNGPPLGMGVRWNIAYRRIRL